MDLDAADAVAFGVMDSGGGSTPSGGSGDGTCPSVEGSVCSGQGSCNARLGKCLCFGDYAGSDCSTDTSSTQRIGNIVLSAGGSNINVVSVAPGFEDVEREITLTNNGETILNYYLFHTDGAGTPSYYTTDASTLPNWLSLNSYSGAIFGGASKRLVVTVDPSAACGDGVTSCSPFVEGGDNSLRYTWHLVDSGKAADPIPMTAR